jgi:threonyl-tRNA synthetase
MKIPYVVVVGDRDLDAGAFTVRNRSGEETTGVAFDRIVEALAEEARSRALEQTDFAAAS